MNHQIKIDFDKNGNFERLVTWHPVDGVWIRIEQRVVGSEVQYITDGRVEGIADFVKCEKSYGTMEAAT